LIGALCAPGHALADASAATTAKATRACKLKGSRTLVKGPTGRIFQRKGQVPLTLGAETVRGSRVYGCLYATGKRFRIGYQRKVDGDYEWISHSTVRLAGPYVAYAHGFDYGMDGGEFLELRDLRTGKRVYRTVDNSLVDVTDVELSDTGSVAWIADEETHRVYTWTAAQGLRTLDSGEDIKRRSLVLDGSTLSWTKGGVPRSAPLP
jgi:hypothetical protein